VLITGLGGTTAEAALTGFGGTTAEAVLTNSSRQLLKQCLKGSAGQLVKQCLTDLTGSAGQMLKKPYYVILGCNNCGLNIMLGDSHCLLLKVTKVKLLVDLTFGYDHGYLNLSPDCNFLFPRHVSAL
jgi:hypothetical protein